MLYPRLGVPLALELVNTQFAASGHPRDALQTPTDLQAWLALNAPNLRASPAGEADLERFQELRAALRRIFSAVANGTPPLAADVNVVNTVCAAAPRFERLLWEQSGPRLVLVDTSDSQSAALATVARSAIQLLTTDVGVGQCQAPGCVLFFTKDARRRHWCSAACGNRARVARHYVRHRRGATKPAGLL